MSFTIKRAEKSNVRLRLALLGPAGSGKTFTALEIGSRLGKRVGVVDTEKKSASKYADRFTFDVIELDRFGTDQYIGAVDTFADAKYDVLIIDSFSHAWAGKGGILEFVDRANANGGNKFAGWREGSVQHNNLVDKLLDFPGHLIVTMRSKMEYVIEKDSQTGKNTVRKVGMQPIQRDGLEFEFDIVGDLDTNNTLTISKSRCPELSGESIPKPGEGMAKIMLRWANATTAPSPTPAPATPPAPAYTVQDLVDLINKHQIPENIIAGWCTHFKVNQIAELSADQLSKLIPGVIKKYAASAA